MKTPHCFGVLSIALIGLASGKTVPNFAIADLVLGQQNFVTKIDASVDSSFTLNRPEGVVIDPISRKVFVSDYENNRVLRYPSVASLANGAGAEAVFGQPNFNSDDPAATALGLNGPIGICLDRLGRLWVAESENNRVTMFEAAIYRNTQPSPDRVFGQPDFTTVSAATTAAKMNDPYGVWVDNADRLWVADSGNNRVLRFDSISTKASGSVANGVLGQPNFTTATSSTTSSSMDYPTSVTTSSTGTLFVGEEDNNRVLRFPNAASLGNGAGASAVLGQTDFNTGTSGLTASKFNNVDGVFLTSSDTLWVTDRNNQRLLRFEKASTKASGAAADGVVGQPNFTTNTNAVTNRGSLNSYSQAFVDASGSLWIADTENYRVLRFPADVTAPLLTVTTSIPKPFTKKKLTIKGTASDTYGISKVQYMVGKGPLQTATGTTSWTFSTPLATGKNTITIFATDAVGNISLKKVIKVKRVANNSPASALVSGN